jgi:hypothetical protein
MRISTSGSIQSRILCLFWAPQQYERLLSDNQNFPRPAPWAILFWVRGFDTYETYEWVLSGCVFYTSSHGFWVLDSVGCGGARMQWMRGTTWIVGSQIK